MKTKNVVGYYRYSKLSINQKNAEEKNGDGQSAG